MKRVITLWLVAMLLLVSCGQDGAGNAGTEGETTVQTEAVTDETKLMPDLPDITYDGAEFRIYHNDNGNNNFDVIAVELTGESLNDIVYQRNVDTEEKFGIKINIILEPGDIYGDSAIKTITAGDDAYDVITTTGHRLSDIMRQNLVYDLNETMPYMDLSQPWWNADFQDNMTINGKLFFAAGDLSHIILESMQILCFNLDSFNEQGLTPPYEEVRNGTWTFDKMKTLVETYTLDLNGDGTVDYDDQFGYFGHEWIITLGFLYSNDVQICAFENGIPYISLDQEKVVDVWEAYTTLIDTAGILPKMEDTDKFGVNMFKANQVLFIDTTMRGVRNSFRDMEADFGVVPLPKFREEIERYKANVGAEANVYSVPVTTTKTEMISAVLEYLAYYGFENITPTYYDVILGQKLMRDQDSRDMLEILRDSMYFDFGAWSGLPGVSGIGHDLLYDKNNPASYLASNKTKLETALHNLLVSVGAIEE